MDKIKNSIINNIIKKVAIDTNVLFVDNNQAMGGKEEYFIDAMHYTKNGINKLVNNYADFIIEHNIIKDTINK